MPKITKHPRLRTYVKKGANGQRWVSYAFDMRGTGQKDIPLGSDYDKALARWDELFHAKKRIAGTIEEALKAWEADVLPTYKSAETKRGYGKSLRQIRPVFGPQPWGAIKLKQLKAYLKNRTAKTQGNRDLSLLSIVWNYARGEGLTDLPWPAHDMERARWKNPEKAREREISDEAFEAIYRHADGVLRDAMDLATATGLRVRDVLGLRLSDVRGSRMVVSAGKTGKRLEFDIAGSAVLPDLIERRKVSKAAHVFLLVKGDKPVTERMLSDRFVKARTLAAKDCPECATLILRDMRKRAAQLAGDVAEAAKLLQHSTQAVTRRHYTTGDKVRPVR